MLAENGKSIRESPRDRRLSPVERDSPGVVFYRFRARSGEHTDFSVITSSRPEQLRGLATAVVVSRGRALEVNCSERS